MPLIHKLGEVEFHITELPDGIILIMRSGNKHISTVFNPLELDDLLVKLTNISIRISNKISKKVRK